MPPPRRRELYEQVPRRPRRTPSVYHGAEVLMYRGGTERGRGAQAKADREQEAPPPPARPAPEPEPMPGETPGQPPLPRRRVTVDIAGARAHLAETQARRRPP